MFGFLNINKPRYVTSRSVVDQVCSLTNSRRVGHAGTLDPLATGVLVVGVGPATRLVDCVQSMPKTYVADFQFGVESSTEDRFGELRELANPPIIGRDRMADTIAAFVGTVQQVPPAHSALKVNGKRAYELARKGKDVSLKSRSIQIHSLELMDFSYPHFRLRVCCGAGTYIRSLGRDIARKLNTGAMLTELERTAIGGFRIESSISVDNLDAITLQQQLRPGLDAVPDLPVVVVNDDVVKSFLDGMFLRAEIIRQSIELPDDCQKIVTVDKQNRLVAIMERFDANNFKPKTNFAHYWRSK